MTHDVHHADGTDWHVGPGERRAREVAAPPTTDVVRAQGGERHDRAGHPANMDTPELTSPTIATTPSSTSFCATGAPARESRIGAIETHRVD